jgi:hypothetical protein
MPLPITYREEQHTDREYIQMLINAANELNARLDAAATWNDSGIWNDAGINP